MRIPLGVLAALVLLGPSVVAAQSSSTDAHPALPWSLGPAIPQGQLLRYDYQSAGRFVRDIWVPPQPVVVEMAVALPAQPTATGGDGGAGQAQATADPQYGVLRQTFVVPGYHVRETTAGFHYPERWVLDRSYTWQRLPPEFRPRSTVFNPGWPPAPQVTPSLGPGAPQPPSVPSLR